MLKLFSEGSKKRISLDESNLQNLNNNPKKPIRILIADDTLLNRKFLRKSLENLLPNAEIHEAKNGEEAIEMAREQLSRTQANYDLIFMDFEMPKKNGVEATQAIRDLEADASCQKSFIVTWSTVQTEPYKNDDNELIADAVIKKPLQKEEIRGLLVVEGFIEEPIQKIRKTNTV